MRPCRLQESSGFPDSKIPSVALMPGTPQNVKAVFLESSINPKLAEQIANDAGVKVVDTLYGDALGAPGTPGGTYEGMMRFDAEAIVGGLR